MNLYLFNPDHDMALGNNSAYYQAPASALKMANDLSWLPAWVVPDADSFVALPSTGRIEEWVQTLPVCPRVEWGCLTDGWSRCREIHPWGWNRALVHRLKEQGVADALLPGDILLEERRFLASRLRAVELLSELADAPGRCGVSRACRSLEEINEELKPSYEGCPTPRKLLKAPWSGSGKGLRRLDSGKLEEPVANWCSRILSAQGAVVVEPYYQKVADFAMEFYADGAGKVSFQGYSLFNTDANGAYKGNFLKSDAQIVAALSGYVPAALLAEVQQELCVRLAAMLGQSYVGYLGVDMMVCAFEQAPFYRLHPCVEINLRMNMGMVAHRLYTRWLSPRSEGIFRVDCCKTPSDLQEDHRRQEKAHPPVVKDGRMESGYLSLTPIGAGTCYRAALWAIPLSGKL